MKRRSYVLIVLMMIVAFGLMSSTCAYAENKVIKFFKSVVKWPFSITKKGTETIGQTTEKAVTTVKSTATSTAETLTGKPERAKDIIIEPVKGTAETAYTAVEGTVKTPIEGTKEAFE